MVPRSSSCRCELLPTVCAGIFILKDDKCDRGDGSVSADVDRIRRMLTKCDIVAVVNNVNSFHPILSALQCEKNPVIGGAHLISNKLKSGLLPNHPTYAYEVDDGLSLYFRADKWSMQNDDTVAPDTLHMVTFGDDPCLIVNLTRVNRTNNGKVDSLRVSVAHLTLGAIDLDLNAYTQVNHEPEKENDYLSLLLICIKHVPTHINCDELISKQLVLPTGISEIPSLSDYNSNMIYRIYVPYMYAPATSVHTAPRRVVVEMA
jgi:hypothetical protein